MHKTRAPVAPVPGELCLAMVTHALVTSQLDYDNTLYVGLPMESVRKFQQVQNPTAKYSSSISCLSFQAKFKVLTYKTINGLGSYYLNDRISIYEPDQVLRSLGEAFLSILPSSQVHLVGT